MSLEGSDQAGVIAVGVAAVLTLGAAVFKAANLRGDSNTKWSSRIDLAAVALDEKTVAELNLLRDEIDALLPDEDAPFDPGQAIVDPSPVSRRVELTAKYYRARVRLEGDLGRVRRLGRVFVVSLVMLILAAAFLTLHFAELLDWDWIRWAGWALGGLGLVLLVAATVAYIFCVDRLASGEILAGTAAQAGADDA